MIAGARAVELNENRADSSQLGIAIIRMRLLRNELRADFQRPPGFKVRAVCDQKAERLQEVVRRFPHV